MGEDLAQKYHIYFPNTSNKEHLAFWQEICQQENLQISIEKLKDLQQIPHKTISKTIEFYNKERIYQNIEEWTKKVAPCHLLTKDLSAILEEDEMLFSTKEEAHAAMIRAPQGHAQNGHATFRTEKYGKNVSLTYPNTTTLDVLRAIENSPPRELEYVTKTGFQKWSQASIDNKIYDIEQYFKDIEKNIAHLRRIPKARKTIRRNIFPGQARAPTESISFDMLEQTRGLALSTTMDEFEETRIPIFKKYGTQMGGGACHLMQIDILKKYNLGIKELSSKNYKGIFKILEHTTQETRINVLKNLEIITEKKLPLEKIISGEMTWKKIKKHPAISDLTKSSRYWPCFVRAEKGKGVSDDLMICYSALLSPSIYKDGYQISKQALESRFFGAKKGDLIDTEDKTTALFFPGGQDSIAKKHLGGLFWKLAQDKRVRDFWGLREKSDQDYRLIDKNEEEDITALGANREITIHSSARHLDKNRSGTCATIEYLKEIYNYAKRNNIRMNLRNIQEIIGPRLNKGTSKLKLTCEEIPFKTISEKIREGIEILKEPSRREEKLRKYIFEKSSN